VAWASCPRVPNTGATKGRFLKHALKLQYLILALLASTAMAAEPVPIEIVAGGVTNKGSRLVFTAGTISAATAADGRREIHLHGLGSGGSAPTIYDLTAGTLLTGGGNLTNGPVTLSLNYDDLKNSLQSDGFLTGETDPVYTGDKPIILTNNSDVVRLKAANPGFVLNNSVSTNNVQVTNAINFAVTFNKPVTFNETVTQQTRIENLTIVDNGTNYVNTERHTTNYTYEVTVRENATNIIDTAIGWQFNNSYLNGTNASWVGTPNFVSTKGGSLVATGPWNFTGADVTGLALGGGTTNQWWLNGAGVGTNDTLEIENGNTNTLSVTGTNIGSRMKYTFTGLATPQNFGVGGDLSGTTTNASVVALRGNSVSSASPQSDYVLAWVGNAWTPTSTATLPASSAAVTNVVESVNLSGLGAQIPESATNVTLSVRNFPVLNTTNCMIRWDSIYNSISAVCTGQLYASGSGVATVEVYAVSSPNGTNFPTATVTNTVPVTLGYSANNFATGILTNFAVGTLVDIGIRQISSGTTSTIQRLRFQP
jgi:hypothetical protein